MSALMRLVEQLSIDGGSMNEADLSELAINSAMELIASLEHRLDRECSNSTLLRTEVEYNWRRKEKAREQRDKLAKILSDVNEFCQQRSIGKIGDSASAALMQRHDELAAQVERLRGALTLTATDIELWIVKYGIHKTSLDILNNANSALSEPRSAALAALKARWQEDQYADGMPAQKAFWEGFERGAIKGQVNIRSHWEEWKSFRQRAQEPSNANQNNPPA